MNKLKLHFVGDNILREIASPVREINDEIRTTLSEMEELMRSENGVGLAAPQVGILKRMIVFIEIDQNEDHGKIYKMINPKVLSRSEKFVEMDEGCLSIQGPNGPVFAHVERPESVDVEWTDERGVNHKKEFSGFAGRAVQHEIDHLDGILFIDYLSSAKREMVIRKTKKRPVLQ